MGTQLYAPSAGFATSGLIVSFVGGFIFNAGLELGALVALAGVILLTIGAHRAARNIDIAAQASIDAVDLLRSDNPLPPH